MRKVELGVFMPVASNGFIFSTHAPQYLPSFDLTKQIAQLAESGPFDYLFWMGKWKGFGGKTGFWDQSLEPLTLVSAIATVTNRLRLFATINPLLFHPAVAAKIIATLDDVSGGRVGINVVTGNTLDEYEQMGMVPKGYNEYRYDYAEEWTTVLKQLWSDDKVTFKGRFFDLVDCESEPKPKQKPYPLIVSAGTSVEGLQFGAKHSNYQFLGLRPEDIRKVRELAAERGRTIKISTNVLPIVKDTDAEAEKEFALLRENLDEEALDNLAASSDRDSPGATHKRSSWLRAPNVIGFGTGLPLMGSPETVARKMADLVRDSGIDGLQLTFVDYVRDIEHFNRVVAPIFRHMLKTDGIILGGADEKIPEQAAS